MHYQAIISYPDGQDADVETTVGLYGKRRIGECLSLKFSGNNAMADRVIAVTLQRCRLPAFRLVERNHHLLREREGGLSLPLYTKFQTETLPQIEDLGEETCSNMASAVAHVSDRINSFETSLRFGSRQESTTVEQLLRDRFTRDRVPVCIREGRDLTKNCGIFLVSPVGIQDFPIGDFKTELSAKEFCESNHLPIEPYEVLGVPNIRHPYYASTLAGAVQIVNNTRHLEKAESVATILDAYVCMKAMVSMVSHTWIQGRASLELLQSAALGIPIDQIAST